MSDTFGPWTPPGTQGTQPTGDDEPGPTTPAILTSDQFWDTSTAGYIQVAEPPPWKRCKLGPFDLPGIVTVTAPGGKLTVDKKAAQKKGGETQTPKGWSGSSITIECQVWTPEHLARWREIAPQIDPTQLEENKPLDIDAEVLRGTSIKAMLVEQVSGLEDGPGGSKVGTITGSQFVKKQSEVSTKTPSGSKAPTDKDGKIGTNAYIVLVTQYVTYCHNHGWIPWSIFLAMNSIDYPYPEPPAGTIPTP